MRTKARPLIKLSHRKAVIAIIKMARIRAGLSQDALSFESGVCRSKLSAFETNKDDPKPDEIVALDKALNENRRLVLRYCTNTCVVGKYAGYQFTELDIDKAGMAFLDAFNDIARALPRYTKMFRHGNLPPHALAKMRQLRLIIMALEVQSTSAVASCTKRKNRPIRERLRKISYLNYTLKGVISK